MKDDKIDIINGKLGMIITECDLVGKDEKNSESTKVGLKVIQEALIALQEDLRIVNDQSS